MADRFWPKVDLAREMHQFSKQGDSFEQIMVQPCAGGTQIEIGGMVVRWGRLSWILKEVPHLASTRMVRGSAINAVGLTQLQELVTCSVLFLSFNP